MHQILRRHAFGKTCDADADRVLRFFAGLAASGIVELVWDSISGKSSTP
jgi:hypothetical protein